MQTSFTRISVTALITGALAAGLLVAGPVRAQETTWEPTPAAGPDPSTGQFRARVVALEQDGRRIVLDNGTVILADESARAAQLRLYERPMVRVGFEDHDGTQLMTWMRIEERDVQAP